MLIWIKITGNHESCLCKCSKTSRWFTYTYKPKDNPILIGHGSTHRINYNFSLKLDPGEVDPTQMLKYYACGEIMWLLERPLILHELHLDVWNDQIFKRRSNIYFQTTDKDCAILAPSICGSKHKSCFCSFIMVILTPALITWCFLWYV